MARPQKKERFKVEAFKNTSGKTSYRVAGYRPDGERVRKNFRYKADAIEYRACLERECEEGKYDVHLVRTKLAPPQIADAETALGHNPDQSLTEQVLELKALRERVAKVCDLGLENAVTFFEKHYRPEIASLGIYQASEKFLTTRTGRSEQTVKYYRNCLKLLTTADPNKQVHAFTTQDIAVVLSAYPHIGSQRTYRRGLSAFFSWAVRAKFCLENPCDHLEALPRQKRDVVILQLTEVRQLLKAASAYRDGIMAAPVAIMLFGGLRPSELDDLTPTDIREKHLVISGGKMEGKIKRRVPIVPVLEKWLEQYPFTGVPRNWYKKMEALKAAVQPEQWVSDILRHTSISYQIERDEDIGKVATRNGTSDAMITLHYRDVVENPDDVTAFWALTPAAVQGVALSGELPARHSIEWPTDAELEKLVWEKPLAQLAGDLGASDTAIRKRCIGRGIKLPKNGHWQRERMKAICNKKPAD